MQGLHLTADLYRCRCDAVWLTGAQQLGRWCLEVVEVAGLEPATHVFHAFAGDEGGARRISGAILMAGSHLYLHTWPDLRAVTVDVLVTDRRADHAALARSLMNELVARFQPEWTEQRSLDRGDGDS